MQVLGKHMIILLQLEVFRNRGNLSDLGLHKGRLPKVRLSALGFPKVSAKPSTPYVGCHALRFQG